MEDRNGLKSIVQQAMESTRIKIGNVDQLEHDIWEPLAFLMHPWLRNGLVFSLALISRSKRIRRIECGWFR